jgi:hypothetical protein
MSDFWVSKIRTVFHRIDFNKDGTLSQADFEGMADRFSSRQKLDALRGAEMKASLIKV